MLNYKKISILLFLWLSVAGKVFSQFAPQAGTEGSTAIPADSPLFVEWANYCKVHRGYINIEDTTETYSDSNRASFGADSLACGMPGSNMDVVSLGDGGWAVLSFEYPICDGEAWDFAVFENGFLKQPDTTKAFLELAFVEVSSDSIHFVRFPAVSLTAADKQVGTFDGLNATKINNLAGKYIQGYGTPFDLSELKDSDFLDINNIRWIKIIDVVGTIDSGFATYDSQGNIINDPYPTPFASGGFDLNAIGVINANTNIGDNQSDKKILVYPNPAKDYFFINSQTDKIQKVEIFNSYGNLVYSQNFSTKFVKISVNLLQGVYFVRISTKTTIFLRKIFFK